MKLTYTHEADFRQERPFGAKINATFEFIGAHFRPLGLVLLYIVLPVTLVAGIAIGALQAGMFGALLDGATKAGQSGAAPPNPLGGLFGGSVQYFTGSYLAALVLLVLAYVVMSATVSCYMRLCLEGQPQPLAPGLVWARVRAVLPALLGYTLVLGVILGLGTLFFLIPGIYLSIPATLFYTVYVMEGQGFGATFNRCIALIKDNWWATFGLILVMSMILGFMNIIFQVPLMVVMFSKIMHWGFMGSTTALLVVQSLATVGQSMLRAVLLVTLVFQYFHLVELKDGTGLRHLVDQLGQAPAPVTNETYRPDEEGEY